MPFKVEAQALLPVLERQLARYERAAAGFIMVRCQGHVRGFYQKRVRLLCQPMMAELGQCPVRQSRPPVPASRSLCKQG